MLLQKIMQFVFSTLAALHAGWNMISTSIWGQIFSNDISHQRSLARVLRNTCPPHVLSNMTLQDERCAYSGPTHFCEENLELFFKVASQICPLEQRFCTLRLPSLLWLWKFVNTLMISFHPCLYLHNCPWFSCPQTASLAKYGVEYTVKHFQAKPGKPRD